jgi:ubiquinol-cytochrome c reductase cytochrome c1 subunit
MGKDVVSFLSWAAEPEMEERKLVTTSQLGCLNLNTQFWLATILMRLIPTLQMGVKWIFLLSLALLQAAYYRRMKWSVLKSRKLVLDVVN